MTAAVVSDGSGLRGAGPDVAAASVGVLLEDDAAGIRARAGLPVWAAPLPARDADDLTAQVLGLPGKTRAVFLTHTDQARGQAVQRQVADAGGPPVLTDADTITITLTAALLTTLARQHHEPDASRVIIAGAAALPELAALLITVGIGDVSSWQATDARAFPLRQLARHATAVIDLVGAVGPAPDDGWPSVLRPEPGHRLLPVPGLCAALVHHQDASLDIDVSRAGALAVAAATPPGPVLPDLDDPLLTGAIAAPVLRVLARRPPSRSPRTTT